jgi:hypothetical protein
VAWFGFRGEGAYLKPLKNGLLDKKMPISYLNRRNNAVLDKWSD